ncbi:MAG: cob(I)yrinic acid a,c-diamide adenosyltransferase [Muribaculaceae bacterium]|nr:cob(I)yrinic acid a,c-diamide adenosyltransferase [Muribaculaceae bacterium]MDE6345950.1 cob(I)yrinic acid a,c-diamide adenosyltransferase [Muribaculaceae bacterium]
MKKSPIYTRTGDKGMTSLVDGTRTHKNCVRIEAYGTVDELNSFIGVLIASEPLTEADRTLLTDIQARLFDIGSYLASGNAEMSERLTPDLEVSLQALEDAIDVIDSEVPQVNTFILPQGAPSAAAAHVARAVARRAERCILTFNDELAAHAAEEGNTALHGVDSNVLKYINRLSDYLFILSRHCNHIAGVADICWHPAKPKTQSGQ